MKRLFVFLFVFAVLLIGACTVSASSDVDNINLDDTHDLSANLNRGSFEILKVDRCGDHYNFFVKVWKPNGSPAADMNVQLTWEGHSMEATTSNTGIAYFPDVYNGDNHMFHFYCNGGDFEASDSFYIR